MQKDFNPVKRLTAAARPVDTYVRPYKQGVAEPGQPGNSLIGLADALKQFNPKIQAMFDEEQEARKKAAIEGARATYVDHRKSFADAVKEGIIDPAQNPYFNQAYKEMQGESETEHEYNIYLQQRWQQSGLAHKDFDTEADALSAYSEFRSQAYRDFVESRRGEDGQLDLDWLRGSERKRGAVESQMTQRHMQQRLQQNQLKMDKEASRKIGDILRGEGDVADRIDKLFNGDADADIGGLRDVGMSGTKFNELVISEMMVQAEALARAGNYQEARDLIAQVNRIPSGSGFLGRTAAGRKFQVDAQELVDGIEERKEALEFSRTQREWALADRDIRRQLLELQADGIPHILKQRERAQRDWDRSDEKELRGAEVLFDILTNPDKDFESVFAELAKKPHLASLVPGLRSAWSQRLNMRNEVRMTPEMTAKAGEMRIGISLGEVTAQDILDKAQNREIDSRTMGTLIGEWISARRYRDSLEDNGDKITEIVTQGERHIRSLLTVKDPMTQQDANPVQVVQALIHYQDAMEEFLNPAEGPKPSRNAIREYRDKLLSQINSNPLYQPPKTFDLGGTRPNLAVPADGRILGAPDWVPPPQ